MSAEEAFSYITTDGQILLIEEVAREVELRMGDQAPSPEVIVTLLRALRGATEALAAHGVVDPEEVVPAIQRELRRRHQLLGAADLEKALRGVLSALAGLGVQAIRYHHG